MKNITITIFILFLIKLGFSQCSHSLKLVDSYGDSWNGGTITLYVNGTAVISNETVSSSDNGGDWKIINFTINTGDTITTDYVAGSWPGENEYYIYDAADGAGTELYSSGTGGTTPSDLTSDNVTGICPAPCVSPTTQATSLSLSEDYKQIDVSFTAASGNPDNYLVIRSTSSSLASNPVNGTTYSVDDVIGSDSVVYAGSSTSFTDDQLDMGTTYYYYVLSYNSVCSGGPLYNTSSPLSGNVTTLSCSQNAPMSEDFESTITPDLPQCWTTSNPFSAKTGTGNAYSGTNHIYITTGYYSTYYIATPELTDLSSGANQIRFMARGGSSGNVLSVGTMTDPSNTSSYTEVQSINLTASYQEFTVMISSTTDSYIAFKASGYYDVFYIDDINYEAQPTCLKPSALTASNITGSSADLSWTAGGSETQWDIELGTSGFTPTGTPTQSSVTKPYTYSGLSPVTDYDYYVRSDCGGGDYSTWEGPYTFTTSCVAQTATLIEDFDGVSTPDLPQCWSELSANSSAYARTTDFYSNSASNSLQLYNYNGYNVALISPEFSDLSSGANQVRFYAKGNNSGYSLKVGTLSDPTDISTFTEIDDITLTTSFDEYTVTCTSTSDSYIAFKHGQGGIYRSIYIDDVVYEPQPSCLTPTSVANANENINSVDISWTEIGSATQWAVIYGANGFDTTSAGTEITGISSNPYTLSGLTANTTYDVYVKSSCGVGDVSTWSGPTTFTTTDGKATNPNPADNATDIAISSTTLNWDDVSGNGMISYKISIGTSPGATDIANDIACANSEYTYSQNWNGITEYYWTVTTVYNSTDEVTSDEWSFTTACVAQTATITEDFDGVSTPDLPQCWSGISSHSSAYVRTSSSYYNSASNSVQLYNYTLDDAVLVSPEFSDLSSGSNQVSFYARGNNSGYSLKVGTISDPSDINTFTEIDDITLTNSFAEYTVMITSTSDSYIAFKHGQGGNYRSIYIDDVVYEPQPSCLTPTSVANANENINSVDISWTEIGSATQWAVIYGANGFDTTSAGTEITGISSNPYTLTGLTANTTYDVYVKSSCGGGDVSTWSDPTTFTTTDGKATNPTPADNATDIAISSTTLNWDDVSGNGTISYKISIGTSPGATDIANDIACSTSDYTYSQNWSGITEYYWTVTTVYNSTDEVTSDEWSFTTECVAQTATLSEDFDGVSSPNLPQCWSIIGSNVQTSSSIYNSSPNRIQLPSGNNYLILPELSDLSSNSNQLRFYARGWSSGNTLQVGTLSDPTDGSTFTSIQSISLSTTYSEYSVIINNTTDSYLAFKHSSGSSVIIIDDVVYEPQPSCLAPTSVASANENINSVDISWTEIGSATQWAVIYGANGFDTTSAGTEITGISSNPYTLTGLTANTTYDVYVKSSCGGGDVSTWSDPTTFTTTDGKATNPTPADNATDIAISSTTLNWDDVSGNGTISYKISIGTSPGATDIANDIACSTSDYTYSQNWSGITEYYWTVTTVYNSTDEVTSDEWSFTTECVAQTATLSEDFDGVSSPNLPQCWSIIGSNVQTSSSIYNSSPNRIQLPSGNNYLILPELSDLSSNSNQLRFYARGWSSGNTLQVGTLSDPTDGSTFTSIQSISLSTTYSEYSVIINNTTDSYLAFKHSSGSSVIIIDDVVYEPQPSCLAPTSVASANENINSVDISWTEIGSATQWAVIYGANGFDTTSAGTEITGISSNPYTLTGLTANTTYDVYVKSSCGGGDVSTWSGPTTFTTTVGKATNPAPSDNATDIAISSTTLNWDDVSGSGTILYKISIGTSPGATDIANDVACANSEYTYSQNWSGVTTYYWTVTTVYNSTDEVTSDEWSFTTECVAQTATLTEDFDGVSSPNLPQCWSTIGSNVQTSSSLYNSSPNRIQLPSGNNYLILPELSDLSSNSNQLRFYARGWSSGNTLQVGTLSDPTDGSTFTSIQSISLSTTYSEYSVIINNTTDSYLAFKHSSGSSVIMIDDVVYEPQPSCIAPTSVASANENINSADISWTEIGSATQWAVIYGANGFDTTSAGTEITGISSNPYTLTGLTANTTYDVYVKSSCGGGDVSTWSGPATFTTTDSKATNPDPADNSTGIATNYTTLDWDDVNGNGTISYKISIGTSPGATDIANHIICANSEYTYSQDWSSTTSYYWTVTTVYNSTNEDAGNEWNFTTSCANITSFPYSESFDTPGSLGTCYTTDEGSTGASVHWEIVSSDADHGAGSPSDGAAFLRMNYYNALTSYNPYYLYFPSFELGSTPKYAFYDIWMGQNSGTDNLLFEISDDGGNSWTTLETHTENASNTSSSAPWDSIAVDLSSYTNSTVTFRLKAVSNYGVGYCNIGFDNFRIDEAPVFWTGSISQNSNQSSNWQNGNMPNTNSTIYISNTAANDLELNSNITANAIQFGNGGINVILSNYDIELNYINNANQNNHFITNGSGKLKLNISDGDTKEFPIGNSAYNPVSISNNTGVTDVFSIRVLDKVYDAGLSGNEITDGIVQRTWDISNISGNTGSGSVDLEFNWNSNEEINISTYSLYHYENSSWVEQNSSNINLIGTSLQYQNYSGSFSPFSIAEEGGTTSLPVELIYFNAKQYKSSVKLSWQTISEYNSKYFVIQHSTDMDNWIDIGEVEAAFISFSSINYNLIHNNPLNGINYYRLIEYDINGNRKIIDTTYANFNNYSDIQVYPNPVSNSILYINAKEDTEIKLYNIFGELIMTENVYKGKNSINLKSLPKGEYVLKSNSSRIIIIIIIG